MQILATLRYNGVPNESFGARLTALRENDLERKTRRPRGARGVRLETKILRDYLGSEATRDNITWAVGIVYRTVLIYIYT